MFRPNPGVDLNDFPVLGTPPSSSNRAAMTPTMSPSSSMLPSSNGSNRISYASTAGTHFDSDSISSHINHRQDILLGGPFSNSPFNQQHQSGGYQQDSLPPPSSARPNIGSTGSLVGQRTFSMDDFPALRSTDGGYMKPRQEPWGSEFTEANGLSSNIPPPINGKQQLHEMLEVFIIVI